VLPVLFDALCEWESQFAAVNYVTKGSNIFTEHYSAVQADVFDPEDPGTGLNTDLIKTLQDMDVIAIAGEASSHCVASTVRDIADNFGEDNVRKFLYLQDACSPVPGFEQLERDFLDDMVKRGMQVSTTDKFLT
jgi:nicotinamidase/pyrazinamidase